MIDEASAEGATTPETLRQKDRKSYETLESSGLIRVAHRRSKAGSVRTRRNLSGFRTAGVQAIEGDQRSRFAVLSAFRSPNDRSIPQAHRAL